PPAADARKHLTLAGDRRLEHVVERAHAIARDHEDAVGVGPTRGVADRRIQVAHLARVGVRPPGQVEGHSATWSAMSVRYCPPSSSIASSARYARDRASTKSEPVATTLSTRPPIATSSPSLPRV